MSSGQTFPASARLARASEFARLKREGASQHGRCMVLSVLKGASNAGPARIGIITSRRVGGAVERNRVRRRLRELFRLDRFRIIPGVWLVIVARRQAAQAAFEPLRAEWRQLAKRGGILLAEPVDTPCSS